MLCLRRIEWLATRALLVMTLVGLFPLPSAGQLRAIGRQWESSEGPFSVVAPKGTTVQEAWADSLLAIAARNRVLRGMPAFLVPEISIRIVLATNMSERVDGRAYPNAGVIALPVPRAESWPLERIERVYRHELAHLTLARLLSDTLMPQWLEEGLSEWAEGGLSCAQEAQLHLDVRGRLRTGVPLPTLGVGMSRSELSYAYYATVLQFVDLVSSGGVTSGAWLRDFVKLGLPSVLEATFPGGTTDFQDHWHEYLVTSYGETSQPTVHRNCGRATVGFYPASADTSEKAHFGPKGVSWPSEGSTAKSSSERRWG